MRVCVCASGCTVIYRRGCVGRGYVGRLTGATPSALRVQLRLYICVSIIPWGTRGVGGAFLICGAPRAGRGAEFPGRALVWALGAVVRWG